jgi:anthranilate synthase/aminodeoxychorismate synthase-like glutamine amidotransferase
MILLIDNYDSFVHNLARYFQRLGRQTQVVRNTDIDAARVRRLRPDAIVLSPGPCTPTEAGCSLEVARSLAGEIPMLGVCLGHQAIAAAWGGKVIRAKEPMHGRASLVYHHGKSIFATAPQPFLAGRYHSLIVDEPSLPPCFEVTARTADGVVMALEHREWPLFGVQFHPESILTEAGFAVLTGFLTQSGLPIPDALPDILSERPIPAPEPALPTRPVTF